MAILPKRSWKWCLAAALLVAAVALAFQGHEPLARMPLADGTELRLEYVTYGTQHRVPGAGRVKAWLANVAQRWPSLKIAPLEAEYTSTYAEPQLCLWFTLFDPKTQKYLPKVDRQLSVTCAGFRDASFRNEYDELSPDGSSAPRYVEKDTLPMPRALLRGVNYPRREKNLYLRVTRKGETAILTVPNPAARERFPTWHPEPLPQTRRIGEYEVVLQAVERYQVVARTPSVETIKGGARFAILHHGQPAPGIKRLKETPQVFDATGNAGDLFHPPPSSESAWKVSAQMVRTGDYPFAPTEGVLFAPAPLPGAETSQLLSVPAAERTEGFQFAALLGPGCYTIQHGALLLTEPAMNPSRFGKSSRLENRSQTVMLNLQQPAVVFIFAAGSKRWSPQAHVERAVRMTCEGEGYALKIYDQGVNVSFGLEPSNIYHTYAEGTAPSIEIYELLGKPKPLPAAPPGRPVVRLEPPPREPTPPAGTPLSIQVLPVQVETLEYLIAPLK